MHCCLLMVAGVEQWRKAGKERKEVERETDGTSTIIVQDLGRVWVIWTQQTNLRCSHHVISFSWRCARHSWMCFNPKLAASVSPCSTRRHHLDLPPPGQISKTEIPRLQRKFPSILC